MTRFFHAILLGLLGAVIVHIAVLFLVPYYAKWGVWPRLEAKGAPYTFIKLEKNDAVVKITDPFFQLRACYFDLTNGPVRIVAKDNIDFWSLSIYARDGTDIYSLNNRTSPNGVLDIVIGDPIQMMDYKQATANIESSSITTAQNIDDGFVILRAFSPSPDWDGAVEDFLNGATCKQIDY